MEAKGYHPRIYLKQLRHDGRVSSHYGGKIRTSNEDISLGKKAKPTLTFLDLHTRHPVRVFACGLRVGFWGGDAMIERTQISVRQIVT